jgi:hypothetical protein
MLGLGKAEITEGLDRRNCMIGPRIPAINRLSLVLRSSKALRWFEG